MVDETPIPVFTKDKPCSTHKGYHWVDYSPLNKLVCFVYRKGRGRDSLLDFLKDCRGTIQSDGYTAYDIFDNPGVIILLSCMAHVRRKFDEARQNEPVAAGYVLEEMQKLYDVERQARELNLGFENRKALRDEKSLPKLTGLEKCMKKKAVEILPKSAMGVALSYTLGLWNRLIRYLDDGRYEIDNNLVENNIRPVALGRKNYIFARSHEGAERAAMIDSFLGTCKKNNVNYFIWLKDILERIPDHKVNRLDELLPGEWFKFGPE
jgi:transposase